MKITIVGVGYVGLVTGVALANIGHEVTCHDIDEAKIKLLKKGKSPIYEPGLEAFLYQQLNNKQISFTTNATIAFKDAEVIFIAVGTPSNPDGTADLRYLKQAAIEIARNIKRHCIIVIKSTVPVGTNEMVKSIIKVNTDIPFDIVSNPEFLREGQALHDTFKGDRIVIGSDSEEAAAIIENVYKPFQIPIVKTDLRSAEMIKYASNAFLATKISFINEIANLCEKTGADIEAVAYGMGLDHRIGKAFLHAGVGYGGSCFPKDTKALVQLAGNVQHDFELLRAVIDVNNKQQHLLVEKVSKRIPSLVHKNIAVLGLSFKPKTDDMREAASLVIIKELLNKGATIIAYDPISIGKAKQFLPKDVVYAINIETALTGSDAAVIVTEWEEIKQFPLENYKALMKEPIIFDGRNCYSLVEAQQAQVEYHAIGRPAVLKEEKT